MGVVFHFLDVGAGDCTIVHWPSRKRTNGTSKAERIMMLDINHDEDEPDYTDVIEYYKDNFRVNGAVKPIFRFVCSHPHQDHICGLFKLFRESGIDIRNFWDLEHDFVPEEFRHPTHEDDWNAYVRIRQSQKAPKVIRTRREASPGKYWDDDEDRITVLSPSDELWRKAHYTEDGKKRARHEIAIDEMSYALAITINSRKVILAGDGRQTPFWQDIYENCADVIKNCSVLKAGHHGQECAFHEDAVKLMKPECIIFSNGEEDDADYGAEKLYAKAVPRAQILKTCDLGTIRLEVPFEADEGITYTCDTKDDEDF